MISAFLNSIARELRFLRGDKWNLSLVTWVPVVAIVWFGLVFSESSPRQLPVLVTDADQSAMSRQLVRLLQASPVAGVVRVSDNFEDIREAVRKREAYAAVFIPAGAERDVARGEQAHIYSYYNTLYYSSANLIQRDLASAVSQLNTNLSAARAGGVTNRAVDGAQAFGAPLSVQVAFLYNAANSYELALGGSLIPVILLVIMGNALMVSLVGDLGPERRAAWVADAGGRMVFAIVCKVIFYALVFTVIGTLGVLWMRWRGWPVNGSMGVIVAAQMLLFLGNGAVCVLIAGVARKNLLFALSAINFYTGGGISFGDILFPVNTSPWYTRLISEIMPYTTYMQVQTQQMQMGSPPGDSLWFLCKLGLFAMIVLLAGLLALRVSLAFGDRKRARGDADLPSADNKNNIARGGFLRGARIVAQAIKAEFSVAVLLFVATVLYTFYYPAAYVEQVSSRLPVAVVDLDNSAQSRKLLRKVMALKAAEVAAWPASFEDARRLVERREVDGILLIDENFGRDALSGRTGRLSIYGNNAFIVRCSVLLNALGEAAQDAALDIAEPQLLQAGIGADAAAARMLPARIVPRPLFNTREGYGSFAVPAVAQLVVHQATIFGILMIFGWRRQRAAEAGVRVPAMHWGEFWGMFGTLFLIALMNAMWVNGYCLWLHDYPRAANVGGMFVHMVAYVFAIVAVAFLAGGFVDRTERALQFFTFTSMPVFFAMGVSWPPEAMPASVRAVCQLVPAMPGVAAFAKLGQMGAPLSEARGEILHLMVIAVACVALAWMRLGRDGSAAKSGGACSPERPLFPKNKAFPRQ
ncbi:ABC-2 type transport system permease protein [Ereboglobus sp. PH5-10]|uniref:ABC transporter permease n=1 Tax=Ereboglobus sp. PH5-10 TaxID=2940629 RepID=UPI0024055576|nr:ABC transporter permease [Ereboglobus sp. PH5-10]MDF9826853.1 ABC-2 type transport system permease protein [Ereboglobus sp. PH5-10]